MKFECLKDYWMYRECEENGDIPAFKAGKIYDFKSTYEDEEEDPSEIFTEEDNQGVVHYMNMYDEFYEYFVEVV